MWREGEDNRRDKKEKIVVKDKKEESEADEWVVGRGSDRGSALYTRKCVNVNI